MDIKPVNILIAEGFINNYENAIDNENIIN